MRIAVSVLTILFGLLHLIAAAVQFRSKDPAARGSAVAMASGGLCAIIAAIFHIYWGAVGGNANVSDAATLAIGCLLICASAYVNGRRSGNVHLSHHLVRGGIAVLLVLGFFLW